MSMNNPLSKIVEFLKKIFEKSKENNSASDGISNYSSKSPTTNKEINQPYDFFNLKMKKETKENAKKALSNTSIAAKEKIKVISQLFKPKLKKGFKISNKINKKEIKLLKKRFKASKKIFRKNKKFDKKTKKRLTYTTNQLQDSNKNEIPFYIELEKLLKYELSLIVRLAANEREIGPRLKKSIKGELKQLLKKTKDHIKIINIENKLGYVNPNHLEEYKETEKKLLQKIKEENAFIELIEQKESRLLNLLKTALLREESDINKLLKHYKIMLAELQEKLKREKSLLRATKDKNEKNNIKNKINDLKSSVKIFKKNKFNPNKKRLYSVLSHIIFLKNVINLTRKIEINEKILFQRYAEIQAFLEEVKKMEIETKAINKKLT
ncbi:hypothetical protein HOL59_02875 [Candidatus Woesearchaeota archaeon]|nr:hypothetical protein [Candidatus Woesearchaeota archaeon]